MSETRRDKKIIKLIHISNALINELSIAHSKDNKDYVEISKKTKKLVKTQRKLNYLLTE